MRTPDGSHSSGFVIAAACCLIMSEGPTPVYHIDEKLDHAIDLTMRRVFYGGLVGGLAGLVLARECGEVWDWAGTQRRARGSGHPGVRGATGCSSRTPRP